MMTYIAVALVLLFAYYVGRTYLWEYQAKQTGTETDAVVSWIERSVRGYQYGSFTYYYYYVRYRRADGLETEARLWNPKKELAPGTRIRIRYLPTRDNYAVLTEVVEA